MADQQIKIDVVTGGNDGHHLMHCYFEEINESDGFNFFDPKSVQIETEPSPVRNGKDFSFSYNGYGWVLHKFKISKKHLNAKGRWRAKHESGNDDPETGTFQAQAGGSVEGERSASASAAA